MRQFLFVPCLFVASFLLAQSKTPDYYQNSNAPAMQKTKDADCYVRKFDAGTSALRRGDYNAALRLFQEAKACPDAVSNSRRIKELDTRMDYCNAKLGRNIAAASEKTTVAKRTENIEITGRKFNVSSALSRNTDPNCFALTVREADRAFRDSCWDDAAKLYRAAKNCADANQYNRESMSNRIEACRAAAEDELLQKEQKAVRTARHAIAANRANDAMELLHQGMRSLAWRLADFANFYIAPDDNPDCLAAMYATYFYQPPLDEKIAIHPPFCYQLSEDLGTNVQFKFTKNKFGERLIAFIPNENKIIAWELPSMKIVETYSNEALQDPIGFDVAPDGGLLFYGANYFYLPNGQKLEVYDVSNYCFSEDGESFYYVDTNTGTIRSVGLNQNARIQQQRKTSNNTVRYGAQPVPIPVNGKLMAMKIYKGEFWLAYTDRVEVLSLDKVSGTMQPRMRWLIGDSDMVNAGILSMQLFPPTRELVVVTQTDTYYNFLNQAPVDSTQLTILPVDKISGHLLACTPGADPLLTVTTESNLNNSWEEVMKVNSPAFQSITNRFQTGTFLTTTLSAAISEDGHWIACQDGAGQTRIWSLQDTCVTAPITFDNGTDDHLSPDGNHLFSKTGTRLRVFDMDDMAGGAQQEIKTFLDADHLPEGSSNNWAVFFSGENEMAIQQLNTKRVLHFNVEKINERRVPYAFDDAETRYFAYSPANGLVVVKSLADQSTIDTRDFGGEISLIKSIPGSNKLLVVTRFFTDFTGNRFTVKVWDFSKHGENPHVVRLQGYAVGNATVSAQGDRIALTDGKDIRIFLLENLDNEAVVLKPITDATINDIAFRPDGLALVSGDDLGKVVIWDIATGQPLLRFSNVWDGKLYPVDRLAYAYGGTRLRMYSPGRQFTANLDAFTLRDVVESGDRWLTSFTPEQIRAYNLEIAFRYPGNFDRLAESGDFPLIRSFFQYFREQSISSNNIEQVRTYCERASTLYELLDAGGQQTLEYTMFEMYEDYILKLLLRNNPSEASRVVMHLEKRFNRPDVAILSSAHSSLVQHDLKAASRLYTDYLLRLTSNGLFEYRLEDINTKLSQFKEYDLLDSAQITCLCEVFQQYPTFEKLCPSGKKYVTPAYSLQVPIYQMVYRSIDSVAYWNNRSAKVRVLEHALQLAKTLDYPNPVVEKHPLEAVVIALADAYLDQVRFEQNSFKSSVIYEKAVGILENIGPFKSEPDTARLSRLATVQLLWGRYLLDNDKPGEAIVHLSTALQAGKKLSNFYGAETLGQEQVGVAYLSPVYVELCKAKLLEGKSAEAQKAYEQANEYLEPKLNSTLTAYVALLENNETAAFIDFGDITTAIDLGEALFQINRMAEMLPMLRLRLLAFSPRLKEAFLHIHSDISLAEVDYWQSSYQMSRYAAQNKWDSVLVWSTNATNNVDKIMAIPGNAAAWRSIWLNQRIYQSYYLLNAKHDDSGALSEAIRYANEALTWLDAEDPNSVYRVYIATNMAHAYWLRAQPGDREKALAEYRALLNNSAPTYDDPWELLQKDFRDLHHAGVIWPDLQTLIRQIKPENVVLTQEDWREMSE